MYWAPEGRTLTCFLLVQSQESDMIEKNTLSPFSQNRDKKTKWNKNTFIKLWWTKGRQEGAATKLG